MDFPRITQWLQIAASFACLIMYGWLFAMWMRSYAWHDTVQLQYSRQRFVHVMSYQGVVVGRERPQVAARFPALPSLSREAAHDWLRRKDHNAPSLRPLISAGPMEFEVQLPYWMLILVPAVFTAVLWNKWRVSLRLVLTGAALVAIGLAWAVAVP
jgi:hypothetical protein